MLVTPAKRFTLVEYHHLEALGFFEPDQRIELICGELVEMAAKGMAHEVCLTRLLRVLPQCLGNQATLRCQSPIILPPNSAPEPDFTIVHNRPDDYISEHPGPAAVILLIEISDSSITYDQQVKLPLYAAGGIHHYWIFNLLDQVLETYWQPYQKPLSNSIERWAYRHQQTFLPHESVPLPEFPSLILDLSHVFPPLAG